MSFVSCSSEERNIIKATLNNAGKQCSAHAGYPYKEPPFSEAHTLIPYFGSHLSEGLLRIDGQMFSSLGRNGRSEQIMRSTVWSERPLFDKHSIGSNHEINQQTAAAGK